MAIQRVGVVGCGLLGSGIAQVAVQAGAEAIVREISQDLVDRGVAGIGQNLDRLVEKGALTKEARDGARARLLGTTRLEELADAELVIEAVVEQLGAKKDLFAALEKICSKTTIFASNTSSLSITEMAATTGRPDTIATDSQVLDAAIAFVERLGKTPVRTTDRTGFIVNRLLVPYLLDAIRVFDEGLASIEDIDAAMRLGCGHPMGPLALADFIGLDTTYHIAAVMFDEFKERRFAPPPLLKRLVQSGRTGRKGGRGFYDYTNPKNPRPSALGRGNR